MTADCSFGCIIDLHMSSSRYQPQTFESKWKEKWVTDALYKTPAITQGSKKRYILDMFPYPSGAGLHVGHPK
jgi:leucyl-tRNA synthetase